MAYNSDGYIMLDFSMVDFRKTNQTIEGLYNRCVDVIGTNKFILVINANGRTPLPATCSFTNNQYVIDTCIYMFAISSNDNLFIRRNDVPASDIIDDDSTSVSKTWSSDKINTELETKQDTLIAGDNITIEGNVISATGGGGAIIDDTVIVNNKVWSSLHTVEELAPVEKLSGAEVTFNTSLALPLKSAKFSLVAQQSGSGTPSPSNPRPISGFSQISVSDNGTTHIVQLGDTYYGGYYDAVGGKFVATFVKKIYDGSFNPDIVNWRPNTNTVGWFYETSDVKPPASSSAITESISDKLKSVSYNTIYTNDIDSLAILSSANNIRTFFRVADTSLTTEAAINAWLADNPITVVYPLATPIEIQLPPLLLSAVEGQNTFSCDTGDTEIIYNYLPIDKV